MVRINESDKDTLDKLSAQTGESLPKLLHRAITAFKRALFFDQINRTCREMQENDPEAWAAYQAECGLWDKTVADGLSGG
jgi:hypothetical protein